MKVLSAIEKARKKHALHFTLIDPDKQSPEDAAKLVHKAVEYGTDAIMIGGSQPNMILSIEETVKKIKDDIPIILFPSSHSALAKGADAVFFMSMLNSRSPQYIVEEPVKGAVIVKEYGLEALPTAYLLVESGKTTSAEFTADAKPLPRDNPDIAIAYALAAKYFGMKFVYLEAGSGADMPVPNEMITAVKHSVNGMFVIVGGGIRDPLTAGEKVAAGADIIVTGTIAESNSGKLKEIIEAVHGK
jgi:phosphoglycerol geranylgeranyltransferase